MKLQYPEVVDGDSLVNIVCMAGPPRINGKVHSGVAAWYPRKKRVKVLLRDRNGATISDAAGTPRTMTFSYSSLDPSWRPGHGPAGSDCEHCAPWWEL